MNDETERKLPWLTACCSPEYPSLAKPFWLRGMLAATDGYRLALASPEAFPDAMKVKVGESPDYERMWSLEDILDEKPITTYETTAEDLATWCEPPAPKTCGICGGKGELPCRKCLGRKTLATSCDDCGHEHECGCDSCDGVGAVDCDCEGKPKNLGRLGGAVIDRNLIWDVIRHHSGKVCVRLIGPKNPVHLVGAGWILVVIPTREVDKELPVFPGLVRGEE